MLKIGIVGLPNVGKSTLFNALTKQSVLAENYPFATIDPNIGVVVVPDARLDALAKIEKSEKIIPTAIEFVDIAGLVSGAHKGEGLGNKFLSHIREVDAIAEVVRFFEDENIHHVDGSIDGRRDIETIKTELILADLETIKKSLNRLESDAKSGDKDIIAKMELVKRLASNLESEKMANEVEMSKEEKENIADLHLLTLKPFLYVGNVHSSKGSPRKRGEPLASVDIVKVDIKLEAELAGLSDDEKKEYLESEEISESGLDLLISKAYETLELITFFTAGPKEAHAWTVRQGSSAPQAAGKIHTDFERGFIKADVIDWKKLVEAGSWALAREKGLVRTEGKEYVMQDGDTVIFKFNV